MESNPAAADLEMSSGAGSPELGNAGFGNTFSPMHMFTSLDIARAPALSRRESVWSLVAMGALTAALAVPMALAAGWGGRYVLACLAGYGLIAGAVGLGLRRERPRPPFGPASLVTLFRAALISLVGGLVVVEGVALTAAWGWTMTALAVAAFSLDAVDGWVARRLGQTTAFGARFDQELDAFFIALLAVVAWRLGEVGAWVLLIGGMRYLFALAGYLWPRVLGRPLPPSRRRKVVCGVQVAALLAVLAPIVGPDVGGAMAVAALIALTYSFGADALRLVRTAPGGDAANGGAGREPTRR